MFSNILKIVLVLLLTLTVNLNSSKVLAETPDEFCSHLEEAGIPDKCTVCGDCAVVTTNVGNNECKKCPEIGGCQLTDCNECAEYPACTEE